MKKTKTKTERLIALLLVLLLLGSLLLSVVPAAYAEDGEETETEESAPEPALETIYISNAEDFARFAENCTLDTWSKGKLVVLQSDISLLRTDIQSVPTFAGVFDGQGHTISGLNITESMTPAALFSVVQENAVIKDLKVSGSVTPSGGSSVGGIAGENYGMIVRCSFTGSVTGENNVGGIAGVNAISGQILACTVSGSVTGDKMTGGVAGCSLGTIGNCKNSAWVNTTSVDPSLSPEDLDIDLSFDLSKLSALDTSTAASDTGGIAGYSSGIITGCANNAPVGYPHIGYNVGGIVGRSCGYIHSCENSADICGRKDVGGIAGQLEPYIAQNLSESTLEKLERQLDELNDMVDKAINDANGAVGSVSSRLNKIADYMDSAAGAASDIRTTSTVTGTVTGGGETDSEGSITLTPPQIQVEGGTEGAGGSVTVITPIGGATVGGGAVEGEIQGGLTEGGIEGENHTTGTGGADAAAQITVTTSLGGLSSAIYGMAGQMRLLNGEMAGASGTVSGDIREIQKQLNDITDTAMELISGEGTGDILIDSSEIDIDLVTLGKASNCKNSGSVNGDISVGGITGAMAMEYELDPEDDIAANMDSSQRRKFEVKVIIQNCENTGSVLSKRNYAGGLCGKMDLGLIAQSENYGSVESESGDYVGGIAGLTSSTIRHCFVKCSLSGRKYVGGITGSGVQEDSGGNSSTVAGCYSMVEITDYREFAGAVSGADAGCYVENYFVSDALAGINGRSYTGKAEPITYEELLKVGEAVEEETGGEAEETGEEAAPAEEASAENQEETGENSSLRPLPDEFKQFTLRFVADGETVKALSFAYGASFDSSVYPDIPEKEGYYAHWDRAELENLRFDTVVTVDYIPYITALPTAEKRDNGKPIFFVEGLYDDEVTPQIQTMPNTPGEFSVLATGLGDFLESCFSGPKVSREIVEQWSISIPEDGQASHGIRYLPPDSDPEDLDVYVKEDGGWHSVETEIVGNYLCFAMAGQSGEIAVISTMNVWWIWLIAGALFLFVLLLLIRLIRKCSRAHKRRAEAREKAKAEKAEALPGEMPETPAKTEKKRRWLIPLIVVLVLFLLIAAAAVVYFSTGLHNGVQAYQLLKNYGEKPELSMELTVSGQAGDQSLEFQVQAERSDLEGRRVTAITQGDRSLYYSEGLVFLENGKAFKTGSEFPDYTRLLDCAVELYRHLDVTKEDGVYVLTAEGEDARAVLKLLMPDFAEELSGTDSIRVEMEEKGNTPQLRFTGSGKLSGEEGEEFQVSALLRLNSEEGSEKQLPENVKKAILSGKIEAEELLTEDILRLAKAWQALNKAESLGAEVRLKADCGPISLNDSLYFSRWNTDGGQISAVEKNGYALYFTDEAVCGEKGEKLSAPEGSAVETAELLDLAYQLCMSSELSCAGSGEETIYTVTLDEQGMRDMACAIAPQTEGMDILFDQGSIRLTLSGGRIQNLRVYCSGDMQILLSLADVAFEAEMEFSEGGARSTLPEEVRKTLEK